MSLPFHFGTRAAQFMRRRAAQSLVVDAGWIWFKGCLLFLLLTGLFLGDGGWIVGAIAPLPALPELVLTIFLALALEFLPLPPLLKWPLLAACCFAATSWYAAACIGSESGSSDPSIDFFKESEEPVATGCAVAASALSLVWQYFLPGFRFRFKA